MSLTFGQAKQILSQYQGKGGKVPTHDQLNLFVIKTLQYLLTSGSPNTERTFELYAVNGEFTAPYEMETPLKIKINGRVGNVVSKWFEFRSGSDFSEKGCYEASDTLFEQANNYYTAYDLPAGGAYVGVLGTADEREDAGIVVSGNDSTGRPIFTNHKGAQVSGEYLQIKKGTRVWSNVQFATIDGIFKCRTAGYTPLYWKNDSGVTGFLSDYSPIEEAPSYRRFRLSIPNCPSSAKITILSKTRLKLAYADNDRIPFDNLYAIEVAGQQINAMYNDQLDSAKLKDEFVQSLVGREAVQKRATNGQPLEVFHATSMGTIKGISGGY